MPSSLKHNPESALICSIRAATLAHYGRQTRDSKIQIEACRWYDMGLECQRLASRATEIGLANGGSTDEKISEASVCAPMMLSIFEHLITTSFASWCQHMIAAGRMLEMRGPENCQDGIMHNLFRIIRLCSVSPRHFAIT